MLKMSFIHSYPNNNLVTSVIKSNASYFSSFKLDIIVSEACIITFALNEYKFYRCCSALSPAISYRKCYNMIALPVWAHHWRKTVYNLLVVEFGGPSRRTGISPQLYGPLSTFHSPFAARGVIIYRKWHLHFNIWILLEYSCRKLVGIWSLWKL